MGRASRFSLALAAVAAIAVAWRLVQSDLLTGIPAGIAMLIALTVMGIFDVWLPRGDYTELGAPFVFATGLLCSPAIAVGVVTLSRLFVWMARRSADNGWLVLEDVARRCIAVSVAAGMFELVAPLLPVASRETVLATGGALTAALVLALDILLAQVGSAVRLDAPLWPLLVGNLRLLGWIGTAQLSATVLLLMTHETLGLLGTAIVLGLMLVTRQSFALLIEIRRAYTSTVEALARAIEAHDPRRRGHAERVARLCTDAARLVGVHGRQLEALNYAALFHDVGRIGSDTSESGPAGSAQVLANVGFLSDSVQVLRILDAGGGIDASQSEQDLVGSYLVARMCALDDELGGQEPDAMSRVASAVGARLYTTTRSTVDRAIGRVAARARAQSAARQ